MNKINIIDYQPQYKEDFTRLSLEWLTAYDLYEEADGPIVYHPQEAILDKGGMIYFAQSGQAIVGTASIKPSESNHTYELMKLAVSKDHQGQGIGRLLVEHCLQKARELKVKKVILESSTKLEGAIRLYEKLGFQEVKMDSYQYTLSDLRMELWL